MDKKHPNSFQQLEKLGEGTYATVSILGSLSTGHRLTLVTGLQRQEQADWRICRTERNSPGLRGRDSVHGHTRDLVDEGAET